MQQDTIGKVKFRIQKSFTPLELVCHGPLDLQTQLLQISWLAIRERIISSISWKIKTQSTKMMKEYLPSSNLLGLKSIPIILDAPAILAPSAA